jgi:transposase
VSDRGQYPEEELAVYGWDTLVLASHLLASGVSKTAVARWLGISRRLLYHLLETGQLAALDAVAAGERPARRRPAPRATKLDAFRPLIVDRLAVFPELSAVRLLAEIRAAGYTGSYTQLKQLVATLRPRPDVEPVVRFETAPGVQAQFDFATVRLPWGTRYAVLVVLGYSRLLP